MRGDASGSGKPAAGRPRAFVLLSHGQGAAAWNRRYRDGSLIGLNEAWPYGYSHAADLGYQVEYSQDRDENWWGWLWRMAIRALLGFDLLHAWRNRKGLRDADVVWTHTESASLAAVALRVLGWSRARLVLQSVWLIDRWPRMFPPHRWLARWLLARADVLTFLSPLNRDRAQALFPDTRCELVLFGIRSGPQVEPEVPRRSPALNILSLGSDRHRDWKTLLDAVGGRDDMQATIVSGTIAPALLEGLPNCRIVRPRDNAELDALYADADVVVVPLQPNLHASGITVAEEAAVKGRALVITDVGGLRAYFDEEEVCYVPPGDVVAMTQALLRVLRDPPAALQRARRAQARMGGDGLGSVAYAHAHVRLSDELLERTLHAMPDAVPDAADC